MQYQLVHHGQTASPEVAKKETTSPTHTIKLGLDIHKERYVAVAQYDHSTPKPARRFAPSDFLPWVESLLRAGHSVSVVYEACGFGFGLYRSLTAAGATCFVIAPRKLDEQGKRVKRPTHWTPARFASA
jgi:transposase